MLKWQADFLLATNAILECTDRICLNTGTCLNFSAFTSNTGNDEICVCAERFFGPNCEFTDDDLVMSGLSYELSSSDDTRRSRRSSDSGDADSSEKQPEYETQIRTVEEIKTETDFSEYFILKLILSQILFAIILVFMKRWLLKEYISRLDNEVMDVSGLNFRNGRCVIDTRES